MYAAEKGALDYLYSIQYVCDLAGMENRGPEAQKLNPSGGVPWIEFDDGTAVAETVAICELLEEVGTGRSLLGESMKERATVRMWQRRVEQQIILPSFDAYRWGPARDFFRERGMHGTKFAEALLPEISAGRKAIAADQLRWLDSLMVEAGSDYICGAQVTLPDIQLFSILDWSINGSGGQRGGWWPEVIDDAALQWVPGWYARCHALPCAAASDPNRAASL